MSDFMYKGLQQYRSIGLHNQPEYNILLVENDPAHAELIARAFETKAHCRLLTTPTLAQARTQLDISWPDLIITDVRLADGPGTELLNQNPGCPTIVMTSFRDEKVALEAMKSGAADYIVKSRESMASLPRTASRVMREWRMYIDQKLARDHQQRLTAILEATPDLICMTNLDGFVTYINHSGRRMLDIADGLEINHYRLIDFLLPVDGKKILEEGIPTAVREGIWTGETTFVSHKGNQVLTSQVLISHRNQQGDIEFISTIARDIRHLRAAEERVEFLAYYDTLTGLPNRNELAKRLEMEVARVNRTANHGALLFIDLDNFKNINDSLGHPVGDLVLQEMAQRLQSQLRADDTVARLGGDEFIIILSTLSGDSIEAVSQARVISNKIRDAIAMEFKTSNTELQVTASIGISMITKDESSGHDLLRFADTAMYQAKREGRNRLEFFAESMSSDVTRQLEMENQLRRALKLDQFRLFYQPLVNAEQKIIGAETLIRWQHPEKGLVAPGEFLDVLESSGQILEVGNWVIETAFGQLADWVDQQLWQEDFMLCINISPRQFQDVEFAENIHSQLQRINVSPTNIVMEVTEHNIIHNLNDAIFRMKDLIQVGVRFSLDDFGTGYSSLSHLKNLPVSHIKIDRSFVRDICQDSSDQAMVGSILAMSKHLGLKVVAEGVEQQAQFDLLRQYDCQYFQGYHFSKPLAADVMEKLLSGDHQLV
jgi:diguanylate cyclase (GGDEF)-like protein/PAS domain S-box-containing protein